MDLREVRYYVSHEQNVDSGAQEPHLENERLRLIAEKNSRDALKRQEREARKRREAADKEAEQFEDARDAALERARLTAEEEVSERNTASKPCEKN